ncbi:DUF4932 domain-containing protein [Robiginitalea sp. SC105]|uniref:DUF4932 domain-containing protein n=1 Tax=Robiginitalea sp. SC105 TaxID=2762332 RepID=UPI00163B1D07|nr:DUF4932 domain-containing protein [Robiginitalea sp. SC105]MBC2838347.1 DUF4932 domain-containing protein [Robiginitalea sp. SC105]
MRTLVSLCAFSLIFMAEAQPKPVEVRFVKNIEFFGYIIELGNPGDNDPDHPVSVAINQYPENRNNETLFEIFSLAGDMQYSSIINLMYHLPEFPLDPGYQLPIQRAMDLGFGSAEEIKAIRTLVNKVNSFYLESQFESIWTSLEPYRAATSGQLEELKPGGTFMEAMESYYGSTFDRYEIVPSLTLWPGGGWAVSSEGSGKATFILGPIRENYIFRDAGFQTLALHEFGHSFVNHVVLRYGVQLQKTAELFNLVREDMVPQGYSNWKTCMIEHFVRAGEVLVMEQLGDTDRSSELLEDYRDNRKFLYLPFIVEKLRAYRLEGKHSYPEAVRATLSDLESEWQG